jgi:hypothetical protein
VSLALGLRLLTRLDNLLEVLLDAPNVRAEVEELEVEAVLLVSPIFDTSTHIDLLHLGADLCRVVLNGCSGAEGSEVLLNSLQTVEVARDALCAVLELVDRREEKARGNLRVLLQVVNAERGGCREAEQLGVRTCRDDEDLRSQGYCCQQKSAESNLPATRYHKPSQ